METKRKRGFREEVSTTAERYSKTRTERWALDLSLEGCR